MYRTTENQVFLDLNKNFRIENGKGECDKETKTQPMSTA